VAEVVVIHKLALGTPKDFKRDTALAISSSCDDDDDDDNVVVAVEVAIGIQANHRTRNDSSICL
jgi:hypothetical protein